MKIRRDKKCQRKTNQQTVDAKIQHIHHIAQQQQMYKQLQQQQIVEMGTVAKTERNQKRHTKTNAKEWDIVGIPLLCPFFVV